MNFCREIQGKVDKHTFVGKKYALNPKVLFIKPDLVIQSFSLAHAIKTWNRGYMLYLLTKHFKTVKGALSPPRGGGGGTPLCDLNGEVRLDRVWFSGCFVLKGISISSLSVLNRVSLHDLMA